MKQKLLILGFAIFIVISITGCSTITRTEEDTYTITVRDTTTLQEVKNAPGNRDNGIVYPSSRTFKSERYLLQYDSVVTRKYPDFIRLGLFEANGLFFAGDRNHSVGVGLFGVYPDFKTTSVQQQGTSSRTFVGGLYRLGIAEWRLRWFRDAANWTIGTSALEVIASDARIEKMLISTFPLYIRKRYYLREEIPYVAITPSFGIGYYPSQYINFSGSIDVGSIGGLNMRFSLGFVAGSNSPAIAPQIINSQNNSKDPQTAIFPYAGLGISVLDFLNLVPETYTEWKDHQHSSWNIGIFQLDGINTGASKSIYAADNDSTNTNVVKGMILKIANASVALPFSDYKLYVGTTLFNFIALGKSEWGVGILPIRVGYWQTVLADELSTEPFIEFNYYPSSMINIGNRLNLRVTDLININFIIGYVSSSSSHSFGSDFTSNYGVNSSFSKFYLGFGFGFMDKIFFPEDLRYNKGK